MRRRRCLVSIVKRGWVCVGRGGGRLVSVGRRCKGEEISKTERKAWRKTTVCESVSVFLRSSQRVTIKKVSFPTLGTFLLNNKHPHHWAQLSISRSSRIVHFVFFLSSTQNMLLTQGAYRWWATQSGCHMVDILWPWGANFWKKSVISLVLSIKMWGWVQWHLRVDFKYSYACGYR